MRRFHQHRHILRQNLIAVMGVCLCMYFAYHAIQGDRSYLQLLSLNKTIENTQTEYERIKSEKEALEKKVVMLRPSSIDKDLLEERARAVLGYKSPGEWAVVGEAPRS